jgi:hypothetical protein
VNTDNPAEYAERFLDWWSFVVFVGSLVFGFVLGTARQRWTQEQLQIRVAALEKRIDDLERSTDTDSRQLGLVANDLHHIKEAIADIKTKLGA